jgi:glycosyltransferase involved in cell wall biosynthesis
MKISVIICCYNSESIILKTINSVIEQSIDSELFNLYIVDNNCSDRTVEICHSTLDKTSVEYEVLTEKKPGLMYARIKGARQVKNEITLFVDDDNILEKDFLKKLLNLYELKEDVGVIGVQVEPLVDESTPAWFYDYLSVYACGKQGNESQDVTKTRMTLFGAGLSFRTIALEENLIKNNDFTLMGRTGNKLLRGDDSELCMKCILTGWNVWYEEDLVLKHNILPDRITWDYVEKARFGGGMASIILDIYRSVNLNKKFESYSSVLGSTLLRFFSCIKQGGYQKRHLKGSSDSFDYFYLKGRIYGLWYFGPRKISKLQKSIKINKKDEKVKISVIMIDGGFRENIHAAKYFSEQNFDSKNYEILWVDYFEKPHKELKKLPKVKVISLNKTDEYHSSYCFNKGIEEAKGELIVIPDADQIFNPDFLTKIWAEHQKCDELVSYVYRYDEIKQGILKDHSWSELESKCILKNTLNYGGCLAVRKKWLLEINGYEMHPIFESGFHANGLDIYTRFKNLGLAIKWNRVLKSYHPWHPYTLAAASQYEKQKKFIEWRKNNLQYLAVKGIDHNRNENNKKINAILEKYNKNDSEDSIKKLSRIKQLFKRIK